MNDQRESTQAQKKMQTPQKEGLVQRSYELSTTKHNEVQVSVRTLPVLCRASFSCFHASSGNYREWPEEGSSVYILPQTSTEEDVTRQTHGGR